MVQKELEPIALLAFGFAINFDRQSLFINSHIENIRTTANLAVLDVGLLPASAEIYEGRVFLAAIGTVIFGSPLHC